MKNIPKKIINIIIILIIIPAALNLPLMAMTDMYAGTQTTIGFSGGNLGGSGQSGKVVQRINIPVVETIVGRAPVLPSAILVDYTDGTSTSEAVIWDSTDPLSYNGVGSFSVGGVLSGLSGMPVTITVNVKPLGSVIPAVVPQVSVQTKVGIYPTMPTVISVEMTDGSVVDVQVNWQFIDAVSISSVGSVTVVGNFIWNGVNHGVTANVTVSEGSTVYYSSRSGGGGRTDTYGGTPDREKSMDGARENTTPSTQDSDSYSIQANERINKPVVTTKSNDETTTGFDEDTNSKVADSQPKKPAKVDQSVKVETPSKKDDAVVKPVNNPPVAKSNNIKVIIAAFAGISILLVAALIFLTIKS